MSRNVLAEASFEYQRKHRTLRHLLPRPIRRALRFSYFVVLDGFDLCLGRHKELVPPRWRSFAGDGDFERTGDEFLEYFKKLAGLQPSQSVLEVGCGIGRMARPLTRFLETGGYLGFDIVPQEIHWCTRNISARYPNFHFHLADIWNQEYNPRGRIRASEFRFPCPNKHFDFAFLTSVFTHLLADDTEHYFSELARVLAPGGKCLATFFLLNAESRSLISTGQSSLRFPCPLPGCWTTGEKVSEAAVAYEESRLCNLLGDNGLCLESINYGRWCGRRNYLSYQDVMVFRKASPC